MEGFFKSLIGFVFSPFVADELMKGILKARLSNISFQVFDDSAFTAESMLYDGAATRDLNLRQYLLSMRRVKRSLLQVVNLVERLMLV